MPGQFTQHSGSLLQCYVAKHSSHTCWMFVHCEWLSCWHDPPLKSEKSEMQPIAAAGKTLAYLVPAFELILRMPPRSGGGAL